MLFELEFSFVIASRNNQAKLCHLIGVIESTDWSLVTYDQERRGNSRVENSPCRTGKGGDYLWQYPYLSCIVDYYVPRERAHTKSPHAIEFPSVFVIIANEAHDEEISNANKYVTSDKGSSEVHLVAYVTETAVDVASNVLMGAELAVVSSLLIGVGIYCDGITTVV